MPRRKVEFASLQDGDSFEYGGRNYVKVPGRFGAWASDDAIIDEFKPYHIVEVGPPQAPEPEGSPPSSGEEQPPSTVTPAKRVHGRRR